MVDVGDIVGGAVEVASDAVGTAISQGGGDKPGIVKRFTDMVTRKPVRTRMYTARGFGEAASVIAAPVALVVVDTALKKPYDDLKERLAKKVIEPRLEEIDAWLEKARSIDTPDEREERHKLPRAGQAREIADMLSDRFGVMLAGSILGQFMTQDYFMRHFEAPVSKKGNLLSIGVDRTVQLGSMVMLNTVASDQAIAAQNGMKKVLMKVGVAEEQAENFANYTVNFTGPNIAAYLVSSELLTHLAKRGL